MTYNGLVVGKRIPVGAAISSIATIIASFYPDHALAIMAAAVPITAIIQVIVVNRYGIIQPDKE